MVTEVLRQWERSPWRIQLCVAGWRPERRWVSLERDRFDGQGRLTDTVDRCVGYAEDPEEADRLFDAIQRSLELVLTGDCEDVDWAEVPEGLELI